MVVTIVRASIDLFVLKFVARHTHARTAHRRRKIEWKGEREERVGKADASSLGRDVP